MRFTEVIRSPSGALLPAPHQVPDEVLARPGRYCAVLATHGTFRYEADFYGSYDRHIGAWVVARFRAILTHVWFAACRAEEGISWAVFDMEAERASRARQVQSETVPA